MPLLGNDGSGHLTLTFVRRQASTTPGITCTPLFNSSPGNGFAANPAATTSVSSIDSTWELVTVTDSVTTSPRFARLQVSDP